MDPRDKSMDQLEAELNEALKPEDPIEELSKAVEGISHSIARSGDDDSPHVPEDETSEGS